MKTKMKMGMVCVMLVSVALTLGSRQGSRDVKVGGSPDVWFTEFDIDEGDGRANTTSAIRVVTDFECMEFGETGSSMCWAMDGVELCVEGVDGVYKIVTIPSSVFGKRSLGHAPEVCISDAPTHLLLTFVSQVNSFSVYMARDAAGELGITCWVSPESVGIEELGWHLEQEEGLPFWGIGLGVGEPWRFVACAIYGILDNLAVH